MQKNLGKVCFLEGLASHTHISRELKFSCSSSSSETAKFSRYNHLVQGHFSISPSKSSIVLGEMGVYEMGNQTEKM